MKARGREVLYTIRDLERRDAGPLRVGRIGREMGFRDGRNVAAKLRRLENARLIVRLPTGLWVSSLRGQEVERLCSAYDHARGGEFRPMTEFVPDVTERLALLI